MRLYCSYSIQGGSDGVKKLAKAFRYIFIALAPVFIVLAMFAVCTVRSITKSEARSAKGSDSEEYPSAEPFARTYYAGEDDIPSYMYSDLDLTGGEQYGDAGLTTSADWNYEPVSDGGSYYAHGSYSEYDPDAYTYDLGGAEDVLHSDAFVGDYSASEGVFAE